LISSPKSSSNKEYHYPPLSPTSSFYKHPHTREIIGSPSPASSSMVSPPTSKHQGLLYTQLIKIVPKDEVLCNNGRIYNLFLFYTFDVEAAIPPLLPPRSGQRHHVSPPINSSNSKFINPFICLCMSTRSKQRAFLITLFFSFLSW